MIFELWHSEEESSYLFFPKDENYERSLNVSMKFSTDLKLVWTYKAKSYFEAMQAYNDYLGYGKYKPEPDWEDEKYN